MTDTETREFIPFPKIPRLNRETVITEKLDGTNSAVVITHDGDVYAQSRNRIITPDADNHGFATWVAAHADELREQLGEGRHFGEWWGYKIGKRYSAHMEPGDKRFSLFNVHRWTPVKPWQPIDPTMRPEDADYRCVEAPLCHVVPVLTRLERLDTFKVDAAVGCLRAEGSIACPGAEAEGIIVFHTKGNVGFKVTLEKDDEWKGPNRVA